MYFINQVHTHEYDSFPILILHIDIKHSSHADKAKLHIN